jgi:hypothetical protein
LPPLTSLLACRRVTRSSRYAARGRRLRSVGCTRAPWAPVAGSSPSLRRPSRCHLHGVCLQNTVCHCAPFTPTVPRMSSAARGSSSQKCLRSSCVRSHGSASPLRRGAAARQFPPSLCRCAGHPLRGPCTLDEPVCLGLCPSPRALGPGEGQGWCSKALPYPALWRRLQSVSVPGGNQRHSPWAAPLGGAGRGFPYPKNRLHPIGRARIAPAFGRVKALENNALRRVFL